MLVTEERASEILESLLELLSKDNFEDLKRLSGYGYAIADELHTKAQNSKITFIDETGESINLFKLDAGTMLGITYALLFQWGLDVGTEQAEAELMACKEAEE